METQISSLCMVSLKNDGYTKRLIRLADLKNEIFVPIQTDGEGLNRNVLHYPPSVDLPDKAIAIFTWKPYFEDRWKQDVILSNKNWIEIIEKTQYSPQQIVYEIAQGVLWSDGTHDLLLIFEKHVDYCLALYWPKEQMCNVDENWTYTSDVNSLYVYKISEHFIMNCKNELQPDKRKYYNRYDLGNIHEKVWLFSPERVIYSIFDKRIKLFIGLGKRERQAIRRVLNEIDSASIIHGITQELNCDLVEAQQHYNKYIQNIEGTIAVDERDGALFQALIENDSLLSKRMLGTVESYWEKTHKETVENIAQLKHEIELKESELLKQKNEINSINKDIERLKNIDSEIKQKIRERLALARSEVSSLLTEYSLLLPPGLLNIVSSTGCNSENNNEFLITKMREFEQIEEAENLEAAKNNIMNNLFEAGISDTKCAAELACYLLAAYYNKVNLLIAGIGSSDIATALSSAICYCDPALMNLSCQINQQDARDIIESVHAQIIVVPNAFGSEHFERIISIAELFPEKMFIFTTPFSQSLNIEPRGLYQYMLPLFTDFYVSDNANRDYIYKSGDQALQEFSITKKEIIKAKSQNTIFSSSLLINKRQEMMIASIKAYLVKAYKDINADQVCFRSLWLPLSICLGRTNQLIDETRNLSTLEPGILEEFEMYAERNQ